MGRHVRRWYEIKAKTEETTEIWLYDEIGSGGWFSEGITAKAFMEELKNIKANAIDLHINSPGGSVFDGIAIYNGIRNHSATVTTYIDGLAASIASVIALAGSKVIIAENAMYMMHMPTGLVIGTAGDMRKTAESLDKIRDAMATTYISKTKKEKAQIMAWMEDETWFTGQEAFDAGFADEMNGAVNLAACEKFLPVMSRLGFKHLPEIPVPEASGTLPIQLVERPPVPPVKDIVRSRRDRLIDEDIEQLLTTTGGQK